MSKTASDLRSKLAGKMSDLVLGPQFGNKEILEFNPLDLYTTGILYPQASGNMRNTQLVEQQEVRPDENPDAPDDPDEENIGDILNGSNDKLTIQEPDDTDKSDSTYNDELRLATNFNPSSAGLSFIARGGKLKISVSYAKYNRETKKTDDDKSVTVFRRIPLNSNFDLEIIDTGANVSIIFDGNTHTGKFEMIPNEDKEGMVSVYARKYSKVNDDLIITITLINQQSFDGSYFSKSDVPLAIFQPVISVESESIKSFPDNRSLNSLGEEELSLELLYRNYRTYALGHGISVNWDDSTEKVKKVWTEVLPEQLVFGVDLNLEDLIDHEVLLMKNLAGDQLNKNFASDNYFPLLNEFAAKYKKWIDQQRLSLDKETVDEKLKDIGSKNLNVCDSLSSRMFKGIELIKENDIIRKAFFDANKAMYMQRVMGSFSKWRIDNQKNIPGIEGYESMPLPDFEGLPAQGDTDTGYKVFAKWRPFQLAFLLSQVEGLVDPESQDRDTTDLIWFPTGGGKTEAYLGLIAMTIFYRRLTGKNHEGQNDPDSGAGVAVLMRYTLRMLNLQQYNRAGLLITACELIRRNQVQEYGTIPISVGIWVGGSLTPNRHDQDYGFSRSMELFINNIENGRNDQYSYSPPLFNCPCCGNRLIKERKGNVVIGEWGYLRKLRNKNQLPGHGSAEFFAACTNEECSFYIDPLHTHLTTDSHPEKAFPFYNVDEDIYELRPTLLFGTTDKFAQLGWNSKSFRLFNYEREKDDLIRLFPGPQLIIQDELHLINSSLGTIYSLYEFAIDKLCSDGGTKPKVVAATATVRNAEIQCKRLYARKNFQQFPPPGIDADDSFYMRKDVKDAKPRKYVGYMTSGFTASTSVIRFTSSLIETTNTLPFLNSEADSYYSLLTYFSSLKELGKYRTYLDDDIAAYRKFLTSKVTGNAYVNISENNIELSSDMTADQVTMALERLERTTLPKPPEDADDEKLKIIYGLGIRSYSDWWKTSLRRFLCTKELFDKLGIEHDDHDNQANYDLFGDFIKELLGDSKNTTVKVACATNMIATGVDIGRLNVMLVNGHPKSSSEYIQASSRVGRESPGIIYSFYAPGKNRDRSHYENFKAFHQSYYKNVEPASVTPGALPALEKALPSVVMILLWVYHFKGTKENVSLNDQTKDSIDLICHEISERFGLDAQDIIKIIKTGIIDKWEVMNPAERRFAENKDFSQFNGTPSVLGRSGEVLTIPPQYSILVPQNISQLQTLRNVEGSSKVSIKPN